MPQTDEACGSSQEGFACVSTCKSALYIKCRICGTCVAIDMVRLSYRKIGIDPAATPRRSPAVSFDANNVLPGVTIKKLKT
jgi:hypothetical protein